MTPSKAKLTTIGSVIFNKTVHKDIINNRSGALYIVASTVDKLHAIYGSVQP